MTSRNDAPRRIHPHRLAPQSLDPAALRRHRFSYVHRSECAFAGASKIVSDCIPVPAGHLHSPASLSRIHDPSVSWVPAPRRPSYATPSTRPARALWIRGLNPMIHPLFREQATYPSAIPHNTATRRDARLLAGADAP